MVDHPFINKLKKVSVLVVGDFGLDAYTMGKAERISPEAPVAVVRTKEERFLPGMAGNVALNLRSLGAHVTVFGRLGEDSSGDRVERLLLDEKIDSALVRQPNYPTAIKQRIVADQQQIVRIDTEETLDLPIEFEEQVYSRFEESLATADIVVISDYGKGFCTKSLLSKLISLTKKQNKFILIDPKGVDYSKYRGATLIKPNLRETHRASGLEPRLSLVEHAKALLKESEVDYLLITLAEHGMNLYNQEGEQGKFLVTKRQVRDVTGAGDTVLATLAFCLANGLDFERSIQFANRAAGIVIERFGCARVTLVELAKRDLGDQINRKIYDPSTLEDLTLQLEGRPYTLFEVGLGQGPSMGLWRALYESKEEPYPFVVLLHDDEAASELLPLLFSLKQVDAVVTGIDESKVVLDLPKPKERLLYKEEQLLNQEVLTT